MFLTEFDVLVSSREIHDNVEAILREALSVYLVHEDVLKEVAPTHIITQTQCEVCAVSLKDVEEAVCRVLPGNPQIVAVLQRPAPGQCLLYVRGGTEDYTPPQPCHVIAVRPFEAKVFWDYPFELESVDDGKRRLCTAAVPDKLTICILPR